MEKLNLEQDLKAFGMQVKTFPNGIKEAFDGIIKMLPAKDKRFYYGISECTNEGIIYIAATAETFEGEGSQYGYDSYVVEKGEYLAETVVGWLNKTHGIKDVFEQMFKDDRADRSKPCIEIYKNDDEIICLVKRLT